MTPVAWSDVDKNYIGETSFLNFFFNSGSIIKIVMSWTFRLVKYEVSDVNLSVKHQFS